MGLLSCFYAVHNLPNIENERIVNSEITLE